MNNSLKHRMRWTGVTAVVGLMVALGACGGGNGTGDPGVVVVPPGEPIEIRTLLSLTGASSSGEAMRASVEMAVEDFGEILGHEVRLGPTVDSRCSPEGGLAGAERIVADRQVLGIIGTSCSAAAVKASPVMSEAGLVMISPSNTSPVLTSDLQGNAGSDHHPGYFRTVNNDLLLGRAVADFAFEKLSLRRVATMHDGDPYTSALAEAFGSAFQGLGGAVPEVAVIEKGQTDMGGAISKFIGGEVDGIFFPVFPEDAASLVRHVRDSAELDGVILITADGAIDPEFLALKQAEDVYFAGPELNIGSYVNGSTGVSVAEAQAAFESRHGDLVHASPYWTHAYDATTLLLSAIRRAAVRSDDGTLRIERRDLPEALRAVSAGYSGLTGSLECDEFGDCAGGVQVIYHHVDSSVTEPGNVPVVERIEP